MWMDLAILSFVAEIIIILVAFMTCVQISSLSQSQLPPLPTYFCHHHCCCCYGYYNHHYPHQVITIGTTDVAVDDDDDGGGG